MEDVFWTTIASLAAAVLFWMAQLTKILKDIRSALADNKKAEEHDNC